MNSDPHIRKVHGRRLGRPLRHARSDALDTFYPLYGLEESDLPQDGTLAPHTLFQTPRARIFLEIGFGSGEFLCDQLQRYPENGYIAAEPFINGMSSLLLKLSETYGEELAPARLYMDDARDILDSLQNDCLDGIFVLNPDPWPKTRHHKRRMIVQDNLDKMARVLKPGGALTITTDVAELAEWMATETARHGSFEWTANTSADWYTAPKDWLTTRYEQKGADVGRRQIYLLFRKKSA
jgi:tRNA (guanine-N7-)-methyltransferase